MAAECRTEYDSLSLQSAGPNEIHLAVVSTLLNNLLREPVSRDWSLVCLKQLDRCPDPEGRQETTDVAAREIPEGVARLSAPLWFRAERTERSNRGRPLHPGALAGLAERSPEGAEERRTPCNAVHPVLPQQGPPSTGLGHKCQDRFIEDFLDWSTTLRSGFVPEGLDFLGRYRPRSRCGGAREATLCLWISLYEELVHGWGCSRPAAPRAIERRGRNRWNAAACLRASWYLSTTESTATPNTPEGARGPSIRKTLSFSFVLDRVNHKCLFATTSAAMAAQWHGRSPWWRGELNQQFSSVLRYHSNWFARPHLALSAGLLDMPVAPTSCEDMHQPDLLPCTPCPPALMTRAAAWWARPEPSETMPHRVTDSPRASVQPGASLCNHTRLALPHYHNNRRRG